MVSLLTEDLGLRDKSEMEFLSRQSFAKGRKEVEDKLSPKIRDLEKQIEELTANPAGGNEPPPTPASADNTGSKADQTVDIHNPFLERLTKRIEEQDKTLAQLRATMEETARKNQELETQRQRAFMKEKVTGILRDQFKLAHPESAFVLLENEDGVTFIPSSDGSDWIAVRKDDPNESAKAGEVVFIKPFLEEWTQTEKAKLFKRSSVSKENGRDTAPDLPDPGRKVMGSRRIGAPYNPNDPAMREALKQRGIVG